MAQEFTRKQKMQELLRFLRYGRLNNSITPTNRIKGATLAKQLGVGYNHKDVVNMVHDLRAAGHPIMSNGKGYCFALEPDEMRETVADLEGRIDGLETALQGLRKYCEAPTLAV